jgi:mannosyl-oligosaccharide alpha-1,2-mannosidase
MLPRLRRWVLFLTIAGIATITVLHSLRSHRDDTKQPINPVLTEPDILNVDFRWRDVPQRHPVEEFFRLPTGPVESIPKIQAEFEPETREESIERQRRLSAVKEAFLHSWQGYKRNAWLQDEVAPLSGKSNNGLGGWGATLIDSLDTLWIMGLKRDFSDAVSAVEHVDFSWSPLDTLNIFETTIRYLGGLLSAYDVSGQVNTVLLEKAMELGDMLYIAFDTPNRMPITRWDWRNGATGGHQQAELHSFIAEVGSMTLEFTRLSQLTGDHKWYDAITRVSNVIYEWQNSTKIPGLWPVLFDAQREDFSKDITFTFGGRADSLYEYFPKQYLMLGGRNHKYRDMYLTAIKSAKEHLFFQPLNPYNKDMLVSGTLKRKSAGNTHLVPQGEHLSCFAGGMVALGSRIFGKEDEIATARQLVDGCLWAYESMPSGIMPEVFTAIPCHAADIGSCVWSNQSWYDAVLTYVRMTPDQQGFAGQSAQTVIMQKSLPQGMVEIPDSRYNLRPEAIESVFVLYRVTGDRTLQDRAWRMFRAIENATKTDIAYASIDDVKEEKPQRLDSMESYWTAETLKYFYLIFSEPDVISLDEYILNTEAHPLLRPR